MNLTPPPSLLDSLFNVNLQWKTIIGELVDNSLDAAATSVSIEFAKRRVRIHDNGLGCDDIEKMLTIGKHYRQPTTRLGRFGIGLKEACCSLVALTTINTVNRGVRRQCTINWKSLAAQPDWQLPDPTESAADDHQTTITLDNVQKALPAIEDLAAEIGFVFMPALLDHKQILIERPHHKALICRPYQLPRFEQSIEVDGQIDGKAVRLLAGVVKEGESNRRPGFIFMHEHRVIVNSSLGAKDYATARFSATVRLDRKWELAKNKDAIVRGTEELEEWLYTRCQPLLEKAKAQQVDTHIEALKLALEGRINTLIDRGRAKRRRGEKHGTRSATGAGGEHSVAAHIQPGQKRMRQRSRTWSIQWVQLGDDAGVGKVDRVGRSIQLNTDNAIIAKWQAAGDEEPLFCVATGLLSMEETEFEDTGQRKLDVSSGEMPRRWSEFLAASLQLPPRMRSVS